eukprot:XP_014788846.1 PREDICTED: RNA-directed DNA polymerase from mobile element jockey-like [Octopus bimaculoides]
MEYRSTIRARWKKVCEDFYTKLFKSTRNVQPLPSLQQEENVPPILVSDVERAMELMKNGKAPEKEGITSEVLRSGREQLWKILAERFTHYRDDGRIPSQWNESNTILLYKKGNRKDLKNYRPICLLSHVYKLFTKIILNRLSRHLDEQKPREQAGFRKNYCTMDHIFTLTQLLE